MKETHYIPPLWKKEWRTTEAENLKTIHSTTRHHRIFPFAKTIHQPKLFINEPEVSEPDNQEKEFQAKSWISIFFHEQWSNTQALDL